LLATLCNVTGIGSAWESCLLGKKQNSAAQYFKALMQTFLKVSPPPPLPRPSYHAAEKRITDAAVEIAKIYPGHLPPHP
jgi:hypothetical protein